MVAIANSPENASPLKQATLKTHTPEWRLQELGHRYYSPKLGRFISRDPIGDLGWVLAYRGETSQDSDRADNRSVRPQSKFQSSQLSKLNPYPAALNDFINGMDVLGLFEIYTHSVMWGHVGLVDDQETRYDYGRYIGTYNGRGGAWPGPNILQTKSGTPSDVAIFAARFDVCPEIENLIRERFAARFGAGETPLPSEVRERFSIPPPADVLLAHQRYMGSDWSPSDNCITFTFLVLDEVYSSATATMLSARAVREARVLHGLATEGRRAIVPDAVSAILERYATEYDWISTGTVEPPPTEESNEECCSSSSSS